jgi:hypothetical protein
MLEFINPAYFLITTLLLILLIMNVAWGGVKKNMGLIVATVVFLGILWTVAFEATPTNNSNIQILQKG